MYDISCNFYANYYAELKIASSHSFLFQMRYREFSRDVTAPMLVFPNNGTAAILLYQTNPPGIELYCHSNVFFCFGGKTRLLIT